MEEALTVLVLAGALALLALTRYAQDRAIRCPSLPSGKRLAGRKEKDYVALD